jgi:iron(III) transport system permease protein
MQTTYSGRTHSSISALSKSARNQSASKLALRSAVGIVLFLSTVPMVYLFIRAAQKPFGQTIDLLFREKTLRVLGTTAILVLAVVALTLLIGVTLASALHFIRLPFRSLLIIPTVLPLAIPSYVFTYTWIAFIPSFSGIYAAIFILALSTLPYVILATLAGLRSVDESQIEVARSLGLTNTEIFFRVVLPQIKGHISAGVLLTALYTLSDFGAVSLLNVESLTVTIQNLYRASYDRGAAAVIALVLIAFSTIVVIIDDRVKNRARAGEAVKAPTSKQVLIESNRTRFFALITLTSLFTLSIAIPFYVLITRFLDNRVTINWPDLLSASLSTLLVAAIGAVIALVLAAPLGILLSGRSDKFTRFAQRIITVGHGLPGVVVGLALVSVGSKLGVIYQTIFFLGFAYALLFLAKLVASINASLARVPSGVKDVATSLGANPWVVIKKVVAPIAAPGISLGTILVFLTAMKELPVTLMLRPTGFETLATEIWSSAAINRFNEAAPYALILVLIAALPTFLISRPDKADRMFVNESMGSEK